MEAKIQNADNSYSLKLNSGYEKNKDSRLIHEPRQQIESPFPVSVQFHTIYT